MAQVIDNAALYSTDSSFSQKRLILRLVIDDISIINEEALEKPCKLS